MSATRQVLDVRGLRKYYPIHRGVLGRLVGQVRAVDDVSFTIEHGETLSLVGESGCGKTTTSRCILRAITADRGRDPLPHRKRRRNRRGHGCAARNCGRCAGRCR